MSTTTLPYQPQCAWCRRFRVGDQWQDTNPRPDALITHDMCPECVEKWAGGLEKAKEAQ